MFEIKNGPFTGLDFLEKLLWSVLLPEAMKVVACALAEDHVDICGP